MKATALLTAGFKSTLTNARGHEIITDLPKDMDGEDLGAMALEVTVMSLSGCISTIFAMVAKKSRLSFDSIDVKLDATKGEKTIEQVTGEVTVKSEAAAEKVKKVLDHTMAMCPVGIIFENAGIKIDLNLTCN